LTAAAEVVEGPRKRPGDVAPIGAAAKISGGADDDSLCVSGRPGYGAD